MGFVWVFYVVISNFNRINGDMNIIQSNFEQHPTAPGRAELEHELAHLTALVEELELEKVSWVGMAAVMTSWDFTKRTIENMRIFNGKSKTL
jgi:hypothetical protein